MNRIITLILLFAAAVASRAVDITVAQPGTAASLLGDNPSGVTALTVSGQVNASDLHYLASLPALTTLDLSGARIVAESNSSLPSNTTTYTADRLPAYVMAGARFKSIILPASITAIESGALMSTAIESLTIPQGVTEIGSGALADCRSLRSLVIPANVTKIGSHLCDGATALESVTMNQGGVPAAAFRNCTALTAFAGPVTEIGDNAFAGCTALKSFPFSKDITTIGAGAFYGSGLTAVNFSAGSKLATVGDHAFASCPALASVTLPDGLNTLGQGAFMADAALRRVTIPASVGEIADFTFASATALPSTDGLLPEGLTSMGRYSMAGMSGTTIATIPSTLESIGRNAMQAMTSLEVIDARSLTEVPDLEADVWHGVDQSRVALLVDPSMENQFTQALQWQDFNISASGIESTEDDASAPDDDTVTLAIDGSTLTAVSTDEITAITIHDLQGRTLLHLSPRPATTVSAALDGIAPQVMIVTVTAGSRNHIFKTAR